MKKWILIGAVLATGVGAFFLSNISKPKTLPMLLMRQFQVADMARAEDESPIVLEPYDAFWYGHSGLVEPGVQRLIALKKPGYRYWNILTLPLPEWVHAGNPWFDWLEDTLVTEWGAYVKDDSLVAARYPWFGNPRLIDWSQISGARIDTLIAAQLSTIGACQNAWLDLYFPAPKEWMFDPAYGVTIDVLSLEERAAWTVNVNTYLGRIREAVSRRSGGTTLTNGDWTAPLPIFLENSQDRWRVAVELWRKDKRNVLSVDPGKYEDSLLAVWKRYGGMIAVTASFDSTQRFYMRADRMRKSGTTD